MSINGEADGVETDGKAWLVFMKKFMKRCAITAAVLFLAGLLLAIAAGTARGVEDIDEVVRKVTGDRSYVRIELGNIWDLGNIRDSSLFVGGDKEYSDKVYTGNVPKYCPGEGIEDLEIQVGGCILETKASEDDKFYIEVQKAYKFQGFVEGGTLYIRASDSAKTWNRLESCTITLYVPERFLFGTVDVKLGAGTLSFTDLCAVGYISMEVGAGQIFANGIRSSDLQLEIGAGEIELRDMEVGGDFLVNIGMGSFEGRGTLTGDVIIECAMGNVELELSDSEKSFDYTLECAMGNIDLGDKSYAGLAKEKEVTNGADRIMRVKCAMGNVTVSFDK